MFLISRGESCSATDNILEVKQKYITAAEASTLNTNNEVVHGNTMIAEGDYAITVYITNNTGFAAVGFRVYYNTDLVEPLLYNTFKVVHRDGPAADGINIASSHNSNIGMIGFGGMGSENSTTDGAIITYYVRPLQGFDIDEDENDIVVGYETERWLDVDADPVVPSVQNTVKVHHYVETFYCIYGDINNDGYITVEDAQILDEIVSDYDPINMDDYTIIYEYGVLHNTVNGNYLIAVGDVDQDEDIDEADAIAILDYYTQYIVYNQNGYTGLIGTTAYYYVEYTVQL
jgi:hypothetical protein